MYSYARYNVITIVNSGLKRKKILITARQVWLRILKVDNEQTRQRENSDSSH